MAASGDDEATKALGIEGALARENPVTGGLEGRPEETAAIPRETYLPFLLALGLAVFFTGLLIDAVRKSPASEYLVVEPTGQVYGVLAASDLDGAFAGV